MLELARRSISEVVLRKNLPAVPADPPAAAGSPEIGGIFVSLHLHGHLRGCIGQLDPTGSLADLVARCARAAALDDPRFSPVREDEVSQLEIEISVLTRPQPIDPAAVRVGAHGLIVTCGRMRGLLLPQVASQYGWSTERFLEETCLKAGLEREAWKDPATRIEAFTAEVFGETESRPG